MKRKIQTIEIKITKRIKVSMETTKIHNLRSRKIEYSPNQEEYYQEKSHDILIGDKEENSFKENDVLHQSCDQIIIRNKWEIIADELKRLEAKDKGDAMEIEIKKQFEKLGITTTLTKASGYNPFTRSFKIFGDNGTDGLAQIKIGNEIIKLMIQSKNWAGKIRGGTIIQSMQGVLATQYPERIGLLIINDGGIDQRAINLAKNSLHNTILIYNFKDLKNLEEDLTKLKNEGSLRYFQPTTEKFTDIKMTEHVGKIIRKIKA